MSIGLEKTAPFLLLLTLAVCGCQLSVPPDPNQISAAPHGELAKILRREIQATADDLNERVTAKQITDQERKDLLAKRAKELLAQGDVLNCPRELRICSLLEVGVIRLVIGWSRVGMSRRFIYSR